MIQEDIKIRALKMFYSRKYTIKSITEILNVSVKSIYIWRKRYKNLDFNTKINRTDLQQIDKNYKRKVHKSMLNNEIKEYIIKYVVNNPKFNSIKFIIKLRKKFDINVHRNTLYKWLSIMNITYKRAKVNIIIDKLKLNNMKKELKKQIDIIGEDNIISFDESPFSTAMYNGYGWNKKGMKTIFRNKNRIKYEHSSLLCGINNREVICCELLKGPINTKKFIDFIKKHANKMQNKYLLMDNVSFHKSKMFKEFIKTTNIKIIYNIPYYPESNPVESILKD
jgi:transposase